MDLLLVEDERQAGEQQNQSVPKVAEHHSEEEGEGDDCERRRIDLPVGGDAVGVDDVLSSQSASPSIPPHLKHLNELVRLVVRRVHFPGVEHVHDRSNGASRLLDRPLKDLLNDVHFLLEHPALGDEEVAAGVEGEGVHRVEDRLLQVHLPEPLGKLEGGASEELKGVKI